MPYNLTLEERFWNKVDIRGPDDCWEWTGGRAHKLPYGLFRVSKDPKASPKPAHRVSWQLTNGPIPEGMFVCHHCDNPPCVNPAHLFLGTPADNLIDMRAKGRGPKPIRGEAMPTSKVTADDVREIRQRVAAGEMQSELALEFGLTKSGINRIWLRHTWAHIP